MTWPTGSLAPQLLPVRPEQSRYVDLPVLSRCSHCPAPLGLLESCGYAERTGVIHTGLCTACCDRMVAAGL